MGTENHRGFLINYFLNETDGALNFCQSKRRTAGDVDNQTRAAFYRRFKQRTVNRLPYSVKRSALAPADAQSHMGKTSVCHNCLDVCKVEINEGRNNDNISNSQNTLTQNVVGMIERFEN